jgi:hypothetical protein
MVTCQVGKLMVTCQVGKLNWYAVLLYPDEGPYACHSERSEESLFEARNDRERRFFAALRMTVEEGLRKKPVRTS